MDNSSRTAIFLFPVGSQTCYVALLLHWHIAIIRPSCLKTPKRQILPALTRGCQSQATALLTERRSAYHSASPAAVHVSIRAKLEILFSQYLDLRASQGHQTYQEYTYGEGLSQHVFIFGLSLMV